MQILGVSPFSKDKKQHTNNNGEKWDGEYLSAFGWTVLLCSFFQTLDNKTT